MRLEGRTPQVTQFQPSTPVSDAAQTAKTQSPGSAQAAINSPQLAKDQFGAAKNAAPEYTNQAKPGLQVPDALRRPDRTSGDPHVSGKVYPCTTEPGGMPLGHPDKPTVGEKVKVGEKVYPTAVGAAGDPHVKVYPCTTEPGGMPLGHPDKPTVGEKVYPTALGAAGKTPLGGQPEPVIGQELGPKPGFVCETEPGIGEKLGPKPGFVCETEPPVPAELRPKPGFVCETDPVIGEKLGPKPGFKPIGLDGDVYGAKSTSKDTEIKVPEPERKPDTSPWGKPIPEPKNPDMWNDDLGQRNR